MRSVREMAIVLPELAPGGDDAGALEETKGEGPDRPPALALRSGIDDGHFAFGTDGLAQDPDIDPLRRHRWRADQEGGGFECRTQIVRQHRGDLGEGVPAGAGEPLVWLLAHPAGAEHQRLDL